ncbi:actin [Tieghemostelium lacteum]|uniref:Actin n=1 Tax=Tieghemostelium lacteum TaxID=361077 RepID=A0A151ZCF4_TIELA|nr:actin [Tieghemostelium lacteum]|eukprot:KYQ91605.1 actin [Tieghemostelium lacteum]
MSEVQALVTDFGTGFIKAGFAGDDSPRAVFPSIVGKPKYRNVMVGTGYRGTYVGDEAEHKRGILDINSPIEHGIVNNWDDFEHLMHHTFYNELKVAPEEHPVLFTEPPWNPKANKEKLTQIAFETFNSPALYVAKDSVLALYASGRVSGTVLSIGHGVTNAISIDTGYMPLNSVKRMDFGGKEVSNCMASLLTERGYNFGTRAEMQTVNMIKEQHGFVSLDYEADCQEALSSSKMYTQYELCDGNKVLVGSERFRAPEILFTPSLVGYEGCGVHQLVYDSIMGSSIDSRSSLYSDVVINGGSTLFPNFEKRLYNELKLLCPPTVRLKVVAPIERKYSTWIGGSILASLAVFQQMWVSKEEYDESGPTIIRGRKCF